MGYGLNLKNHLDRLGIKPSQLEAMTGISKNTIYTIFKRDSPVRYDFALRISNATGIPLSDICKDNPYENDEVPLPAPTFENEPRFLTEFLEDNRAGVTGAARLRAILTILGVDQAANAEQILTTYAKLTDEGRKTFFDFLIALEKGYTDTERANKVAKIVNIRPKLKDQAPK